MSRLLSPFSSRTLGSPAARQRLSWPVVALALAAMTATFVLPVSADSILPRSSSPEGAKVYFIAPADGEEVSSPVIVRFGLSQMGVAPAGVQKESTGHHHLVVDADLPTPDLPIPASDSYRHFGKGQTEVELELEPGEHTLQLVLGDHLHIPHAPPVVSKRITIKVK